MAEKEKTIRAYGVARGMHGTPVSLLLPGAGLAFSFKHGPKMTYLVFAPIMSLDDAVKLIKERIKGFMSNEDSRESFSHKVQRKAIAAQGVEFVNKLKKKLESEGIYHGDMEWKTMFSPVSHTSTMEEDDLEKVRRSRDRVMIRLWSDGRITGSTDKEYRISEILFSDGSVYRLVNKAQGA